MVESRPPPTNLGSETNFALHAAGDVLTVWVHHRNLGQHGGTWEQLEQYETGERVEISGSGLMIKEADDVWYLVDALEDVHLHGEYPMLEE